ncbi:MAG: pesticidal protein Cry7Aa [Bacteroidetes bacterium]|nr:pesticidal protein Cry7Aa [Bacteroidota bacterium]
MIEVVKHGILLSKSDLGFEHDGVLNPGVIRVNDEVHMFYRAVGKGNYSTLGYCIFDGPFELKYRSEIPVLFPQFVYENHGVEDPRITKIGDVYYLTYTAYDGLNALGAYATSTDLTKFVKQGILVPMMGFHEFAHFAGAVHALNEKYYRFNNPGGLVDKLEPLIYVWDKNVIFFPRLINNQFVFLHRIKPDIQIVKVDSLEELNHEYWQTYLLKFQDHIVLTPHYPHEVSYIGSGCPPIETSSGWLLIYHGVHDTPTGYVYTVCAALLDLNNPQIEISRLPYPLFQPELDWELSGEVNNVCFPTGAVVYDKRLYIYYGAADERIATVSIVLEDLIAELLQHEKPVVSAS